MTEAKKTPDRLPHGSEFRVSYSAATLQWHGYLSIPENLSIPEQAMMFHGEAGNVFMLLKRLDTQHRRFLKKKKKKKTVDTGKASG